jgi:hypothetical protein
MIRLSRLSLGGSAKATASGTADGAAGGLAATACAGSVCVTTISGATCSKGETRDGCDKVARARGRTETG